MLLWDWHYLFIPVYLGSVAPYFEPYIAAPDVKSGLLRRHLAAMRDSFPPEQDMERSDYKTACWTTLLPGSAKWL
jgi:hypothetical protein